MIEFKYFAAGTLIFWAALLLILAIVYRGRIEKWWRDEEAPKSEELPLIFTATLYDIKKRPAEILDTFTFSISRPSGREDLNDIALKMLKGRDVYGRDDDVKELVRFHELGGETAGHEFDVLPEALRRFFLEIFPHDKREKVERLEKDSKVRAKF